MASAPPNKGPRRGPGPMAKPPGSPPSAAPASAKSDAPRLGKAEPVFLPPRVVINAVEGFGKTTAAAYADDVAMIMARGETGYQTLLGAGLVPQRDAVTVEAWPHLLTVLKDIYQMDPCPYKTIALDALGGFERLCHEEVCRRNFGGDWSEKGFLAYHKGYDVAISDWLQLLNGLDKLRMERGCAIVLLSHCKVKRHNNPLGEDFDRYVADCHEKTWSATHRWADCVLFGNFLTIVDTVDGKKKGIDGTRRFLYAERRDAYDAKNRYGCSPEFELGPPETSWQTIWGQLTGDLNNHG